MSSSQQQNRPGEDAHTQSKSPHVPGQYAGYSLQARRVLARLLDAPPGSKVSLEVFDDVGVETTDGLRQAEQVKSTLRGNPVSDRSLDLWKTFSNWVDAVRKGELVIGKTTFDIYVSRKVSGKIVQSFSDAESPSDALDAFIRARESLWGPAPGHILKSKLPETIDRFVKTVFEAQDITIGIIKAFTFASGSGDSYADLEAQIEQKFISPEFVSDVLTHGLGWVKRTTDQLIEKGRPAVVSRDLFHREITTYVRKIAYRGILESYAKSPSQQEIDSDLQLRVYVRQLEMIDCDDEDKLEAVKDFLLASVDRTHWSEKGLVHDSSFDEFEENLIRTWRNNRRASAVEASHHDDINKGKLLYSRCSAHTAQLEGFDVPGHFTPGSFQALSDDGIVGWHPDYLNRLKALEREGRSKQ
jgi:hypothetical protein